MQQLAPTTGALYVVDLLGGPSQLRRFDLEGKSGVTIPVPPISNVQEIEAAEDGSLLFRAMSYTEPAAWFKVGAEAREAQKTALVSTSPVSFFDIEVTREFAPSKDGTKVPYFVVAQEDVKANGRNPTLLYGYGGFEVSMRR